MAQTTFANGRGIVHVSSGGSSVVSGDVCNTPDGSGGSQQISYTNTGMASNTTGGPSTVTTDGMMPMVAGASYATTSGDEAGTYGGVLSGTTQQKAEFMTYSFDVLFEGKSVCRLGDSMFHNNKNTSG